MADMELMYAVKPEFTSHLLTFVLPRDKDDLGQQLTQRNMHHSFQMTSKFELSLFFRILFFSPTNRDAFVLVVGLYVHTIIFHPAE